LQLRTLLLVALRDGKKSGGDLGHQGREPTLRERADHQVDLLEHFGVELAHGLDRALPLGGLGLGFCSLLGLRVGRVPTSLVAGGTQTLWFFDVRHCPGFSTHRPASQ
jgi:hypothetical protein